MIVKKMGIICTAIVMLLTMFCMAGCGGSEEEEKAEVQVMAAASLTDALDEIIAEYEKDSDCVIQPNYAGSGDLVQQIEGGAPCDIFISASKANMDQLEEAGYIDTDTRKDLLTNSLTLIASTEKADVVSIDNLTSPDITVVALGEPETVPAGKYATQVLENEGILGDLQDKIVYAKDVRAVLNYVTEGEADCGFVYRTDAVLEEDNIAIIGDVDASLHDPIVYPAAVLTDAPEAEYAAGFYEFLTSDFAKEVFEKYGFTVK